MELNESRAVKLVCEQNYDRLALHWMDLANSKVIPLIIMFITSILFIYFLRRSRRQIHSLKESGIRSVQSLGIQLSRRDNRQAVSVICFDTLFFLLNLPIFIIIVFSVNSKPSDLVSYTFKLLYYTYYAVGFYVQIIVNREFRNEFLKLLNLRVNFLVNK